MKYLPLAFLVILASCSSSETKRIDIVLKNDTGEEIAIKASSGILKKTIELKPGEKWEGWVPLIAGANEIKVEIRKK